ncbi:hypothetical protein M8J77_005657 [Diaphorina citri]|nr:hypothetical protein M8J77_005657 [Diaphorina citri]
MGAPSFGREAEAEDGSVEGEEENCECEHGLSCKCCIRLNFTLIDFGEPGKSKGVFTHGRPAVPLRRSMVDCRGESILSKQCKVSFNATSIDGVDYV